MNRRTFLQTTALTATASLLNRSTWSQQRVAANDRLSVGIIGLGSRGFNLLDDFLAHPQVQMTALCDVHDDHYRDRPWGEGAMFGRIPAREKVQKKYSQDKKSGRHQGLLLAQDFRYLCESKDIDIIVVATPDHWHARCALTALEAGKDVYCEKPVTHLFTEGLKISDAVADRKAVFQTGSQQRSDKLFQHAVNLVRNGVLGKIQEIQVGLPSGYSEPQDSADEVRPPIGLNYDFWCGPAPQLPYMRARHHRWWRGNRAYGGGVLMDWIGHHNDIAHWSLDLDHSGPTLVEAVDWTYPDTKIYDTPEHYTIRCEYQNGVTSTISDANEQGTKWIGQNGWLHATRGQLKASNPEWIDLAFNPGPIRVQPVKSHVDNFVQCVISRETPLAPAETAHRSITPGHLGYVSDQLKRPLKWNAETQQVIDDPQANQLLNQIDYRAPWSLS